MDIDKILESSEAMQNEVLSFINNLADKALIKNKNISYDSIKDTYYLIKISELEEEIYNLKLEIEEIKSYYHR
jgi:hypothetical protein